MYKYNIEIQLLAIKVRVYPYTVVVEGKKKLIFTNQHCEIWHRFNNPYQLNSSHWKGHLLITFNMNKTNSS